MTNEYGFGKLLTMGFATPKIKKSDEAGYGFKSAIQYLSPHKSSGVINVCPAASLGCIKGCLNTAGRGRMNSVQKARLARTKFMAKHPTKYKAMLTSEIEKFCNKCDSLNKTPAVRLNGTSDRAWEKWFSDLITDYSNIQFYDYTKIFARMMRFIDGELPVNYHLTFSRSEVNDAQCKKVLRSGGNVAVVFRGGLPKEWLGYPVYDADKHDLRFLDPFGIGGLTAKGKAKKDTTGFVVTI